MTELQPAGRHWTWNELNQLEEMLNAGDTAAHIAQKLNRTPQAIYARVQRIYRKRTSGQNPLQNRVQWGLKAKK